MGSVKCTDQIRRVPNENKEKCGWQPELEENMSGNTKLANHTLEWMSVTTYTSNGLQWAPMERNRVTKN